MALEYIDSEFVRMCKCVHVCLWYICAHVRERKKKKNPHVYVQKINNDKEVNFIQCRP